MKSSFEINGRRIGSGFPTLIVAEISANHAKSFDQAVELVRAAKKAGADAIKLQTYTPDALTISSDEKYFKIRGGTPWDGRTLYDLYDEACMPWEWQPKLKTLADELGVELFSTAYDASAVDFLEHMGVSVHKVASFELVDIALIENMASTGKPLIMSTGMATLGEIEEAIVTASKAGAKQIALLKCTSSYPAPPEEMNLKTITHLAEAFRTPIGLSDHTLSIAVPVIAVSMGACIVEKHFTLSRKASAPDSAFSLEPQEFAAMVQEIRIAEKSVGEVRYGAGKHEAKSLVFRRSLFVVKDMKPGEIFSEENVRSIRPSHGLHPRYLRMVLERPAARAINRGTPLSWDLIL